MKRAIGALLPLLLWACEPTPLPAPSILSVEPEKIPAGLPAVLSVKVSAVMPLAVDYQTGEVDPSQLAMTVQVAGQVVEIPFADPDGMLILPVPEGLELGDYDLRVSLADGREAVRERAFSVVPAPTPTGGDEDGTPDNGGIPGGSVNALVALQLEPIGEQVRGVPFRVTLLAVGPAAESLQTAVTFRVSKGTVNIQTPCSFSRGVAVKEISLSIPAPNVYLLAEDTLGHKALSNSFRVRPH